MAEQSNQEEARHKKLIMLWPLPPGLSLARCLQAAHSAAVLRPLIWNMVVDRKVDICLCH